MTIPRSLSRRLRAGRVIPFVGAGVSMSLERTASGGRLFPSWHELLLRGADRLEEEGKSPDAALVRTLMAIDEPDLLYAARHLRNKLGPIWADFLREQIDLPRADVNTESLALARAVWGLGSRLIVTTNYDRVLQWACPEELRADLGAWDIQATAEQAQFLREDTIAPTVWHLHGRIRNAARLILTPDGYQRLYGSDSEAAFLAAQATLRHLLISHTLLFIGFSLEDEHFGAELKSVTEIFEGHSTGHYALARAGDEERLKRQALPLEWLTFEDFGAPLLELLEELGRCAAAVPARATAVRIEAATVAESVALGAYLEALVEQTDHINISGIGSQVKKALRRPIEALYTPLSSHGVSAGESTVLGLERERIVLTDLLLQGRLLIEGQPGAGKTTFLRLTACMLARDVLGVPCPDGGTWRQRYLGLSAEEKPKIPVLLQVSQLASWLAGEAPRPRDDNRFWLLEFLARASEENGHPIDEEHWEKLFAGGNASLLIDGLDEAAEETLRRRILRIFRDACRHWSCPIVLTSRPVDTASLEEMDFRAATIEPFTRDDILAFVDRWVEGLHEAEHGFPGGEARRYRETLTQAIVDRARVRRLAANPVMLTCLCVVHWNEGRLPEGRSRVYQAVIKWLIAARSKQREAEGFSDFFAERAFARLALEMSAGEGGKSASVDLEDAAVAVSPLLKREQPRLSAEERRLRARQWLAFECLGSGILEEISGKRLRFWHLTFQEFLAARQLSWRGDSETKEGDWWPLVRDRLDDAQWRETVEMLPGCLLDGGTRLVDQLFERVLALRHEGSDLAAEARVAGILGRLLKPVGAQGYKPSAEISAAYEEALKRSLEIFELEGASRMEAVQRIAAAEALGRGGDPRLTPGVDHFLAAPRLDGCRLGKYPVTVEEYQRFVEGLGYEDRKHWGAPGWDIRDRMGWEMPDDWYEQLQHPNRPVTGVSWYEARAYCRWRSELGGQLIRLPSEGEWTTAATAETGKFPWGAQEPTPELANFGLKVGEQTPVGVYPAGNGPHGHCDLAGNVWEWCANRAARDLPERALRGGSWANPASALHTTFCGWARPTVRHPLVGFRALAAQS